MYTINLTPEEPCLDGSQLPKLVDLWLAQLRLRLPASTVDGYGDKVAYFVDWWTEAGQSCGWVFKRDSLLAFNNWLTNEARNVRHEPLAYNTRNDVLRRLRQMFRWAFPQYVPVNVAEWIPEPVGSAPLRVAADIEDVARLILAAKEAGPRDMALVALFLGTGVRREEAANLDVTDVVMYADLSGVIMVRKAKKVRGRNVHARQVAFDADTGEYLAVWLNKLPASGPLFPQKWHEGRLNGAGIYKTIKRLVERAGLQNKIQGPHDLRRVFATTFARYRRGEGYGHLLSKQLGHSSYGMTAKYSLQDIEDVREAMISPLALLNSGIDGKLFAETNRDGHSPIEATTK